MKILDRNIEIEQLFNDTMIWISKMIPQYSVSELYKVEDIKTIMSLMKRAEAIQKQREINEAKQRK